MDNSTAGSSHNRRQRLVKKYNRIYSTPEPIFNGGAPEPEVVQLNSVLAGGKALDLGAGDGRHSLYLARNGFDVTAIDLSEQGLKKLNRAATMAGVRIQTIIGDADEISSEQRFDVVVCSFVLYQLPRPRALSLLAQLQAQTNPGGVHVIIAVTKQGDFYTRSQPEENNFYLNAGELQLLYTGWELLAYTEVAENAVDTTTDGKTMVNVCARMVARKPQTDY